MKDIPNRLKCAYCIRNRTHGGECAGQNNPCDEKGCLIFKPDEKGCIRNSDFNISFSIYQDIPLLNTWTDGWQFKGVDTEIRINRIYGLTWDTKKGYLQVHCRCDYFANEYSEDYVETTDKPKLKVIK